MRSFVLLWVCLICMHGALSSNLQAERDADFDAGRLGIETGDRDAKFDAGRIDIDTPSRSASPKPPQFVGSDSGTTGDGQAGEKRQEMEEERQARFAAQLKKFKDARRFRGEKINWRDYAKAYMSGVEEQTQQNEIASQQTVQVRNDPYAVEEEVGVTDDLTGRAHVTAGTLSNGVERASVGTAGETHLSMTEEERQARFAAQLKKFKDARRFRGEKINWRDYAKAYMSGVEEQTQQNEIASQQTVQVRNDPYAVEEEVGVTDDLTGRAHVTAGTLSNGVERASVGTAGETHVPMTAVIVMTFIMAASAGLGALPFFFVRTPSPHWIALTTAVACGVMVAASFDLIHEGQPYGGRLVVLGIFLGGWFIRAMQRWLNGLEDVSFGHLHGNRARRLVLMVGIMAAHALGEGCGVGVSFGGDHGWSQGVLTTLAIGVHNVPEGLAKATVLISQGANAWEALVWSTITCLPQPLVAIPSFLFVETFKALLPVALGFAAGCMIWMVLAELLPDALKEAKPTEIATTVTISAAALEGIRMGFETLGGSSNVNVIGETTSSISSGMQVLGATWHPELTVAIGVAVAPGALAALFISGAMSSSFLPTAMIIGFGAAAAAVTSLGVLVHQVVALPAVPVLHTIVAAIFGAILALIVRRIGLQAAAAAHIASRRVAAAQYHQHRTNGPTDGGVLNDMEGQPATDWREAATRRVLMNRVVDATSSPQSPSKSKAHLRSHSPSARGFGGVASASPSKGQKRLVAPTVAAGWVTLTALMAQAVPLGWHFTRQLTFLEDDTVSGAAPPLAAALAVRAMIVGAASRAAFDRCTVPGVVSGMIFGLLSSLSMLVSHAMGPRDGPAVLRDFSYPVGWTDTLAAVSCGWLAMAALMMIAVGMSMHPRHTRFGLLVGMVVIGGAGAALFGGCYATKSGATCNILLTYLQ